MSNSGICLLAVTWAIIIYMSTRTLWRVLALSKANPEPPTEEGAASGMRNSSNQTPPCTGVSSVSPPQ